MCVPRPKAWRPNVSSPELTASLRTSCSQVSNNRKLTKPGPAISTASTWAGRFALRRSVISPAKARGLLRPAGFQLAIATLEDQSPCSRRAGRSSSIEPASTSTPTAVSAPASASVNWSRIMPGSVFAARSEPRVLSGSPRFDSFLAERRTTRGRRLRRWLLRRRLVRLVR